MTTHPASRSCYLRGCRRPECKQADYRYMSRIRLDYERGRKRRLSSTQTRVHIERLLAAGWTQAQIARAAGIAHRTVGTVREGSPTIANGTARAILAVRLGPPPADSRDTDATGTTRRVRALVAIGWPLVQLGRRFGLSESAISHIACGDRKVVRLATADTIALEYRELCRTPGPSVRARNTARRRGWHGPLAWDDIDDPNAAPDDEPPYRPAAENGRDSMRMAEVEHLYLLGESPASIAKQMDGNEKYVRDLLGAVLRRRAARLATQRFPAEFGEAA